MTQIAFVAYPGFTALDMIGPYEVLRNLPGAEVRFVWHEAGPITADSGVLVIGATHSLAETPSRAGRAVDPGARARRGTARVAASGAPDRHLDDVGVFGFGDPGGGRPARGP